jgi:hypothetical protein
MNYKIHEIGNSTDPRTDFINYPTFWINAKNREDAKTKAFEYMELMKIRYPLQIQG